MRAFIPSITCPSLFNISKPLPRPPTILRSSTLPSHLRYRHHRFTRFLHSCSVTEVQSDEQYMHHALQLARQAAAQQEVPIGAVLVDYNGTVLGTGQNSVEDAGDVTQHAEIVALRRASQVRGNWRLHGTTLYSTLEPCPMCLSALALARVSCIVYAAPDLRLGACGTWVNLAKIKHPFHEFDSVRGGVLEEEAAELMRTFFRRRRLEGLRSKEEA